MKNENGKIQNKKNRKRSPAQTKRLLLIFAVIALALILLTVGLIWYLVKSLSAASEKLPKAEFESYLTEKWTVFQLRSWDPETGCLELDYPLRFSYAQMEKYGGSLEELRELPEGNGSTVAALRSAAYEDCGVTLREVTVYGISTDGQTAYTLLPDGTVRACWNTP